LKRSEDEREDDAVLSSPVFREAIAEAEREYAAGLDRSVSEWFARADDTEPAGKPPRDARKPPPETKPST